MDFTTAYISQADILVAGIIISVFVHIIRILHNIKNILNKISDKIIPKDKEDKKDKENEKNFTLDEIIDKKN